MKQTEPPAAMRERFEKWHKAESPMVSLSRADDDEDTYADVYVQERWIGWQASLPSEAGIEAVARQIADSTYHDRGGESVERFKQILREWLGKDSHGQAELLGRDPE